MQQVDEMRAKLTQQLGQSRSQIAKLSQELTKIQNLQKESEAKPEFEEYVYAERELLNSANEDERAVLSLRALLQKKISKCKYMGYFIFAVYVGLVVGIFAYLKKPMSIESIPLYLIAAVIGIVGCVVAVKIMKSPVKRKLAQTFSDPRIAELDKKVKALESDFRDKRIRKMQYRQELVEKEKELKQKLTQAKTAEEETKNQLSEIDFNFKYKNTILFYGRDGGNRYDIYIDGLLYDTVKGKQIIKIILTPGLHSFKVDNTHYNIVDGSVDYSITFNTIQIMVGEELAAYPIVCEYKTIKQVTGTEFQKITKTNLM